MATRHSKGALAPTTQQHEDVSQHEEQGSAVDLKMIGRTLSQISVDLLTIRQLYWNIDDDFFAGATAMEALAQRAGGRADGLLIAIGLRDHILEVGADRAEMNGRALSGLDHRNRR